MVTLGACSSYHPRAATPTPFPKRELTLQRAGSIQADFTVIIPPAWKSVERRNGQVTLVKPPAGKGTLRLISLKDPDPPPALSRAYAQAVGARALQTVGLQANISAVRTIADGHLMALSEGIAAGTTIIEAVHIFDTGQVMLAFFRAPSRDNHFGTATRILKSVQLKAGT
jgi:hypothetical protein